MRVFNRLGRQAVSMRQQKTQLTHVLCWRQRCGNSEQYANLTPTATWRQLTDAFGFSPGLVYFVGRPLAASKRRAEPGRCTLRPRYLDSDFCIPHSPVPH
jgi:hypothetical protein